MSRIQNQWVLKSPHPPIGSQVWCLYDIYHGHDSISQHLPTIWIYSLISDHQGVGTGDFSICVQEKSCPHTLG